MTNSVAMVVGGLRGIGRAISLDLVNKGFIVYATTREKIIDTEIENLVSIQMNVMKENEIDAAFKFIEEQHGKLDILVNNAGIGYFKSFEDFSPNEWKSIFETNVFGMFYCTKKAFSYLKKWRTCH